MKSFKNLEDLRKHMVSNNGELDVSYGFNSNSLHYNPEMESLRKWSVFWSIDGELTYYNDEEITEILKEMELIK